MSLGELKYNGLLAYNEKISFKDNVVQKVEKLMIEIQQNYFEASEQTHEDFTIQSLRFNEILVTFFRIIDELNSKLEQEAIEQDLKREELGVRYRKQEDIIME